MTANETKGAKYLVPRERCAKIGWTVFSDPLPRGMNNGEPVYQRQARGADYRRTACLGRNGETYSSLSRRGDDMDVRPADTYAPKSSLTLTENEAESFTVDERRFRSTRTSRKEPVRSHCRRCIKGSARTARSGSFVYEQLPLIEGRDTLRTSFSRVRTG